MRLLELCLSSSLGGLEIHFKDFSTWIARERPDVRLYLGIREGTPLDSRLARGSTVLSFGLKRPQGRGGPGSLCGLPVIRFRGKAGVFPLLKARRLARFISDNSIDVLHIHDKYDLPLAALAKAISRRDFRLAHSRHMNLPGQKKGFYHRLIYGKVDLYIVITKYLQRQARSNLPIDERRIRQVYYGCEVPGRLSREEKARIRGDLGMGDKFTVGLVGRVKHFKGQHLLVRAIEKLKSEGIDASAVIVGGCMEPDYLDDLKRYVAGEGLDVVFHGFHENIPQLMQCFDVVVLTTKNETFGLVLVEAMLAGAPVIGSNAGGVPEIIDHGETGLLFESFDAASLADQIRRLYQDRALRTRLALAGQEKAKRMFLRGKQFPKFLEELLALREGPAA